MGAKQQAQNKNENNIKKSFVVDGKVQVPVMGSRCIQRHLSVIPVKGTQRSLFLDIAVDSRSWETGATKPIRKTNAELAVPLNVTERTVKRLTKQLTEEGLIVKKINKEGRAGKIINLGLVAEVPDQVFLVAQLIRLERSIVAIEGSGFSAEDKRADFEAIYTSIRSANSNLISMIPALSPPSDKNDTTPGQESPEVVSQMSRNTKRAAAKERSADILKTHSLSELSEFIENLNSKNIFSRFEQLPNAKTITKSHRKAFEKELKRLLTKKTHEEILETIEANLLAWETCEAVQIPHLRGSKHVLKRLLIENIEGLAKGQHAAVTKEIRDLKEANSHMSHEEAIKFYAAKHRHSEQVLLQIYPGYQAPKPAGNQDAQLEDQPELKAILNEIPDYLSGEEWSYFRRDDEHKLTTVNAAKDFLERIKREKNYEKNTAKNEQVSNDPTISTFGGAEEEPKDQKPEPKNEQIEPTTRLNEGTAPVEVKKPASEPVVASKPIITLVEPIVPNPKPVPAAPRQEYVPAPERKMSKAAASAFAAVEREAEAKKQIEEAERQARVAKEIMSGYPKPTITSTSKYPIETGGRGTDPSELGKAAKTKKQEPTDWYTSQGQFAGNPDFSDFCGSFFNFPGI
ncbi:MAG: hypothetical protein HRU09_09170 [Oligoflexales bacterium]|nr:hypothetical protein [Oligoflexales bacterium]